MPVKLSGIVDCGDNVVRAQQHNPQEIASDKSGIFRGNKLNGIDAAKGRVPPGSTAGSTTAPAACQAWGSSLGL
jgi:hypothetical protein